MTRAFLLVCLLSGGCLIVPAAKSTTRPLDHEYGEPVFKAGGGVTLAATAQEEAITVKAIRAGQCTRPVFAHTEVTTEKHAKLGGSDDPRAQFFGLLVSPVLIPVSALITGIVVAADSPETKDVRKPLGTQTYACTLVAAYLPIHMTLPSGAVVQGTTDLQGTAVLDVPKTEPFAGNVALAAAGATDIQIAYALPRPPFVVTREVATACATKQSITGTLELKLSIDSGGHASRVWLSAGNEQVHACIAQELANVRFPAKAYGRTVKMPLTL